jgi:3-methylfumaryl-CoA hydratase
MNMDVDLKAWIGRQESSDDVASFPTLRRLGATLDWTFTRTGTLELPPLSHWLYFLPMTSTAELKSDGHPRMGGFMPPIELPRRMWAGGRVSFLAPISIDAQMTKRSTITNVSLKDGNSGPLVFVTVKHEIMVDENLAVVDEQDIVYREPATPGASMPKAIPAPYKAEWRHRFDPSPTLLFRYSALTFNSHRIHYDKPYACDEENYPNLVVHGPLIATLLANSVSQEVSGVRMTNFDFRAVRPLFADEPLFVCGARESETTVRLWAETLSGAVAMSATATIDLNKGA